MAVVARAVLVLLASTAHAWMPDTNPKIYVKQGDDSLEQFVGNETASDHFRILDKDDFSIIVGGRNTVYNLSLYDLSENIEQRIEWQSTDAHRELCQLKGKSSDECQNYPRVAARSHGQLLVCGTNAFKPLCRRYARQPANHHLEEFDGSGRCPYDPQHNSTSIFTDSQLYTATAADFSGTDPLIYREPVRTERSDSLLLNDPSFVSAVASTSHVYFFYRETAVEYMNCGKAVYSRVARVCKNDKGGPHTFSDRWTSFMKARLNCSIPGEYPFYFDEIQATTELINGEYGHDSRRNDIVYGVFTTPQNAIGGSAVCAFAMRDILDVFSWSFKGQESMNSNWLPVREKEPEEPENRPGSCVEDSRTLSDSSVNFIKTHSLMDTAVYSFLARPILVRVSLQYRFSAIAVHPQVRAMNGARFDVLYIGTDDGRVIKAVNVASNEGSFESSSYEYSRNPVRTSVISEMQVLPQGVPIKQMHVALTTEKLIVSSGDIIKAISLSHCGNVQSCRECVSLQDPHCAWDSKQQQCSWVGNRQFPNPERFLQLVEHGNSEYICNKLPALLPSDRHTNRNPGTKKPTQSESEIRQKSDGIQNEILIEVVETKDLSEEKNTNSNKHETDLLTVEAAEGNIYSATALLTAVVTSCLVTLMLGFIIGYLFSRRFRHPFLQDTSPFNEQHNRLNRCALETPLNANTTYMPPRSKNVNMVANVCPKPDNLHLEIGKDRTLDLRNSTESLDKDLKCGTLQKVKKTYI